MHIAFTERDFFKAPFDRAELQDLITEHSASDIFSWKSPSFKALGRDSGSLSAEELLDLMLGEPRLIRRPLIKVGNKLIIGGNLSTIENSLSSVDQ